MSTKKRKLESDNGEEKENSQGDQTLKDKILNKAVKIIEICTAQECQDCFRQLNVSSEGGYKIFGLDVEFINGYRREDQRPALIQVALDDKVFLIRLPMISRNYFADQVKSMINKKDSKYDEKKGENIEENIVKFPPSEFLAFLTNKNFIKVGVGIFDDIEYIEKLINTSVSSDTRTEADIVNKADAVVDLRVLLKKTSLRRTRSLSLASLCKHFLGITLSMSPADWGSLEPSLTPAQRSYAASDAFFSLQLFYRFLNCAYHPIDEKKEEKEEKEEKKETGQVIKISPVVCSPLYPSKVKSSTIDMKSVINFIGKDLNKSLIYDENFKNTEKGQVAAKKRDELTKRVTTSFSKKQVDNPRVKHLSSFILAFPPSVKDVGTADTEHLETLAQINILSAPVIHSPELYSLVTRVVDFCISWRWSKQGTCGSLNLPHLDKDKFDQLEQLDTTLAEIKLDAKKIDILRKESITLLNKAEKIIKDRRKKKYDENKKLRLDGSKEI